MVWPREQLIQASNKRDTDQKKQTRLCIENANRSKTFDTVFVASFIYVCAQENLVQRLYIISMFGYAFIGVKNNWGTGRWEWPRFAKRVSARQVGTGTVCQDEPRWQGGPEAVAWKLSKLRWCWGEAGTEWHPPPPHPKSPPGWSGQRSHHFLWSPAQGQDSTECPRASGGRRKTKQVLKDVSVDIYHL